MPDPAQRGRHGWRRITPGAALMALGAVIVGAMSSRDAAVLILANQYPELAIKLAPANATAITHVFDKTVVTQGGLGQNFQGWIAASKQALRADPLNASGVRLLAYTTELTPNGLPRARQLMQLSERASRRDMFAQIWLIEDSVRKGDVASALKHYDRALSVRPVLAGQLFPVLITASSEPDIQTGLVPYLRANRPWVPSFLSVLVAKSSDPVGVATLFRRYGGARAVPSHAGFETGLLKRLIQADKIDEARSFALAAGAGKAVDMLGFSRSTTSEHFRPLTWSLYEGSEGEVSSTPPNALTIAVRPETKIVAATRIMQLRPARTILRQRISYPDRNAAPLVTWKAYCRQKEGPPKQFWIRDLPASAASMSIEAAIDIPGGCAGVQIDIEATGAAGSTDSKAVIDRVELTTR